MTVILIVLAIVVLLIIAGMAVLYGATWEIDER
jgi:hypothetical protein